MIQIFISYSHQNKDFMTDVMAYLKGLEKEGVHIWTDQKIAAGEKWDDEIKQKIAETDITLALVSQAFLNSHYCMDIEISRFIHQQTHIIPVIYSACEWERHDWLKTRLCIPGGHETIEEHYTGNGPRQRILLEILNAVRIQMEKIQSKQEFAANPFDQTLAIKDTKKFIGRTSEMKRLKELLTKGSASIVGQSKIGKSSLLCQLVNSWQGEILGVFDFQSFEDKNDFFESLAEELHVLNNNWRDIRKALKESHSLLCIDEIDIAA